MTNQVITSTYNDFISEWHDDIHVTQHIVDEHGEPICGGRLADSAFSDVYSEPTSTTHVDLCLKCKELVN